MRVHAPAETSTTSALPARRRPSPASRNIQQSFAEMFERDLDALIVHLLEVGLELVAALGAAREELDDIGDGRAFLPLKRLDLRRRAHVYESIEVVIHYVVEEGVDVDSSRRLVADAQHLCP